MGAVHIAIKTLQAFEESVRRDQGAAYRGWLGKVIPHIGDAYRTDEDGHRSHMGASLIGSECARHIWYNFRWATKGSFSGRILRLFNRGHLEEARFIAMLLAIGCEVYQQDAEGNQYRISHAEGHFGGSGDGVMKGIPDLPPNQFALGEFKTHSEKSFIELAGKLDDWRKHVENPTKFPFTGQGVRGAKLEHYVQMQEYMVKMGLAVAIYIAVNKNTDDVYAEIVYLDREIAEQFLTRGETLVWMAEPPKKLNESPGFWKCRLCDDKPVCHFGADPDKTCRSCEHSFPAPDAKWRCRLKDIELDKKAQLAACDKYSKIPNF
jgi:hypothetical protein